MNLRPTHIRQAKRKQEGAAMFVVLVVIMIATSSALFATSMASMELEGSGFARQRMQAGLVAEAAMVAAVEWVDVVGSNQMLTYIDTDTTSVFSGDYPEPALAANKKMFRLSPEFITPLVGPTKTFNETPFDEETSLGPNSALEAWAVVDFNDYYLVPQPIAGMRADGKSQLNFLNITMTARGLLRIPDGNSDNISDDVTVGSDPRGYNESARDARMYISKPIMLNQ